jgi:hypothetical protein
VEKTYGTEQDFDENYLISFPMMIPIIRVAIIPVIKVVRDGRIEHNNVVVLAETEQSP